MPAWSQHTVNSERIVAQRENLGARGAVARLPLRSLTSIYQMNTIL